MLPPLKNRFLEKEETMDSKRFKEVFGFAFSAECESVLPIAEKIISLKLGQLAIYIAKTQNELAIIMEKGTATLSIANCITWHNEAVDCALRLKRAEIEFQVAVQLANDTGKFRFEADYATYPNPWKTTTEKGTAIVSPPAIGMR